MQQSSATQSLHFGGLRKIVACSHSSSQCLFVSTVFGTVSSLHPTSFLMIFTLVEPNIPTRMLSVLQHFDSVLAILYLPVASYRYDHWLLVKFNIQCEEDQLAFLYVTIFSMCIMHDCITEV